MQAVIFTGIPAAGKSTFYRRNFFRTHIRISLDMLRTRHRENELLQACLNASQAFVVDNTNLTATERSRYIELAHAKGFEVVGYYFRSQAAESLARNAARPEDEQIPERGVLGACGRLEIPSPEEGFANLRYVRIVGKEFVVEDWKNEA